MVKLSGVLTPNTQFTNANIEKTAKAGSISTMCGKKLTPSFKLIAGDIGVLTKLADTKTGDTLCDPVHPIVFPWVTYPEPSYSMAIVAKKKGEEDKIMQGLQRPVSYTHLARARLFRPAVCEPGGF